MALPGIIGERPCRRWTTARELRRQPLLRGGWNASESVAGFRRNHRLVCVGMPGWDPSEYAVPVESDRESIPATTVIAQFVVLSIRSLQPAIRPISARWKWASVLMNSAEVAGKGGVVSLSGSLAFSSFSRVVFIANLPAAHRRQRKTWCSRPGDAINQTHARRSALGPRHVTS